MRRRLQARCSQTHPTIHACRSDAPCAAVPLPQISTGLDSATTFEICNRLRTLCQTGMVRTPGPALRLHGACSCRQQLQRLSL